MNSLTELNGYATNLTLTYEDQRTPDVILLPETPVNQSQIVDKGFSLSASVGTNIVEVINTDLADPYYIIDLSGVTGATLTWPTLPSGVIATTPSTGVYRLDGIVSDTIWNQIKSPTIATSISNSGLFTYTSTIGWFAGTAGNKTKTWSTSLLINNVVFLTTPVEYWYSVSETAKITGTPQIINVDASYPSAVWTVTVTPSNTTGISTFTSTGTGGTFSVNSTTKVITITGTRTQVNSHLANISMTSTATAADFSLTYFVTQNVNAITDQLVQLVKSLGLIYLSEASTPTLYFAEDGAEFSLSGVPIITDSAYNGLGEYTYTITPSNPAAVQYISSIEPNYPGSYNSTSKSLTLTGTRSFINSILTNLRIRTKTSIDWDSDFTISYTVVTPRDHTATKLQLLMCNTNDIEITNMAISRNYTQNNSGLLFVSNIPYISDFDTSAATYTISFSSPIGLFGFGMDIPVSNLTFSGTKAECNAKFSQVRFWPNKGQNTNSTFTYIQQKNSVTQVNQTVTLIGSAGSFTEEFVTITSSGNWTPSYTHLRYASTYDVLLVGGGGGGAYGGGSGAAYIIRNNITITNTSYPIVIGQGGAAASAYWPPSGSFSYIGGTGGTTSAFGYSINGGYGGRREYTSPSTWNLNGGSIESYSGGVGFIDTQIYNTYVPSLGTTRNISVRAGGGGASLTGNGVTPSASGTTYTRGLGGPSYQVPGFNVTVGGGGQGASLRFYTTYGSTVVYLNETGEQGAGYGGGGGGAYGSYSTSSSSPTAGKPGVVIIRIR